MCLFFTKIYFLGVQQLAKIKHPRILSLQHPIEESRLDLKTTKTFEKAKI